MTQSDCSNGVNNLEQRHMMRKAYEMKLLEEAVALVKGVSPFTFVSHIFDVPQHVPALLEAIPSEWTKWMEVNTPEHVRKVLAETLDQLFNARQCHHSVVPAVPESLRSFVQKCAGLAATMRQGTDMGPENVSSNAFKTPPHSHHSKMSVKKAHEVTLLERLTLKMARDHRADVIVDIGAGTGYLSAQIAQVFPVIAIDGDACRTSGCQKRAHDAYLSNDNLSIEHHTIMLNSEKLIVFLNERFSTGSLRVLLVCLHACGDLSAKTMIDAFLACPAVCAMVSVGCCYNLLSAFPCSAKIGQELELTELSYVAKSSAAHCLPRSVQLMQDRWIRFYQSAMLDAMMKYGSHVRLDGPRVSKIKFKTFPEFAIHYALRDPAGDAAKSTTEAQIRASAVEIEGEWGGERVEKLIAFLSFAKIALAPVLEGVLLQDRLWYLRERMANLKDMASTTPRLVQVFDPSISPRCMALLASKD